MSQLLIQKYLNDLETLRRVSGTNRESVVRRAFERLLEEWGKSRGLVLIPEWEHRTAMDERRVVDGALVEPQLRLPFGYWEAKDTNDDLEQEIAKKLRRGYPQDNIIFEDSETAVLIQNKREVRANPKLSGTKHNVFGIQTGVAIGFFVKKPPDRKADIHYVRRPEFETADEKLAFLSAAQIATIRFETVDPDAQHNWINVAIGDFDSFMPIAAPNARRAESRPAHAVFSLYSTGIMSGRDEWVYDLNTVSLAKKIALLSARFSKLRTFKGELPNEIKWSRNLKRKLERKIDERMPGSYPSVVQFRPFLNRAFFPSELFVDELGAFRSAFLGSNVVIAFLCVSSSNPLAALASQLPFDYGLLKRGNGGTQGVYRFRYTVNGERIDNITDWALEQFRGHYASASSKRVHRPLTPALSPGGGEGHITKDAIFHYVYGVLHDPVYREKYALNLKREFPRIPFYAHFWTWADWGKALMALHIGYENVEPWPLQRVDAVDKTAKKSGVAPKALLKARKDIGAIELDSETQLTGVPQEAWEYRLGNRSALEWILDQYKEKTPKDPTIREKFNTYRFADYRDHVIDLLKRVTRVSVETTKIIEEMKVAKNAR